MAVTTLGLGRIGRREARVRVRVGAQEPGRAHCGTGTLLVPCTRRRREARPCNSRSAPVRSRAPTLHTPGTWRSPAPRTGAGRAPPRSPPPAVWPSCRVASPRRRRRQDALGTANDCQSSPRRMAHGGTHQLLGDILQCPICLFADAGYCARRTRSSRGIQKPRQDAGAPVPIRSDGFYLKYSRWRSYLGSQLTWMPSRR